jgi:hypothetical protein
MKRRVNKANKDQVLSEQGNLKVRDLREEQV